MTRAASAHSAPISKVSGANGATARPSVAGRVPPHDLDAEAAVLSCVLLGQHLHVLEMLQPRDFYSDSNGKIWDGCRELHRAGRAIDVTTVRALLADRQVIAQVGGAAYLAQIADATPSVANVADHVRIVRAKSLQRRIVDLGHRVAAEGYGDVGEVPQWLASVHRELAALESDDGASGGWRWISAAQLAEPLPPVPWVVPGLQLGPGRPCAMQSYGGGLKTLAMASAVVSCAAGRSVWGYFSVPRALRVRHIDLEMGRRASQRRYQRLALGQGADLASLRIELAALPRVRLTDADAREQLLRAADGVDLVAFDSLRVFLGDADENDSSSRRYLDLMTDVSERVGVTWLGLHHVGKAKDGHSDARQRGRGSSALFDAWGTAFDLAKVSDSVRRVSMVKCHPEAAGMVEPFDLEVTDIPDGRDPRAGVVVRYRPANIASAATRTGEREAERQAERDSVRESRVRAAVDEIVSALHAAAAPVTSQAQLTGLVRGARDLRQVAVARALSSGRIAQVGERPGERRYVVCDSGEVPRA